MKLKQNSLLVYEFVKEHEDENITADDIAEATGLTSRQVNGIITMAFCRHKNEDKVEEPLMERIPGEVTVDGAGKPKVPKYIKLTTAGHNITVEEAE